MVPHSCTLNSLPLTDEHYFSEVVYLGYIVIVKDFVGSTYTTILPLVPLPVCYLGSSVVRYSNTLVEVKQTYHSNACPKIPKSISSAAESNHNAL
jgi:hypothetical protein